MRQLIVTAVIPCLALLLAACDPPGKPAPEPPPPSEITDFKFLFGENCSGCHGNEGREGPGRILNDPIYLAVIPEAELRRIIEQGRPGTAMPAWAKSQGGPLSPKQMDALIAGMRGWRKSFSAGAAPVPNYLRLTAGDSVNGKKLFLRGCFACHAQGARVGVVTDPSYLSLTTNQNLRTSIIVGRPDFTEFPMPDYRHLKAGGKPLNDAEIDDIVAYLASLRPAVAEMNKIEEQNKLPERPAMDTGTK